MAKTKIVLLGATGRMGQAIQGLFSPKSTINPPEPMEISACPDRSTSANDLSAYLNDADVAIDFTLPNAIDRNLAAAKTANCAYVCGVTGLKESQQQQLTEASRIIPLLYAGNMSPGITLMQQLVMQASRALKDADIHILDVHHTGKQDAPSGTAVILSNAIVSATSEAKRPSIESRREGDVIGEHVVTFDGLLETLHITHTAKDRRVFAHGALVAAAWIKHQPPGLYSMQNVLGA